MNQLSGCPTTEETALNWHRQGKDVALAWVIDTWGSAPRPVGSLLAISSDAGMAGSVSGGCVEGAVVTEALDSINDGMPRLLEYGVSDDEAFAVGLACGGRIRIFVEPVSEEHGFSPHMLEQLVRARSERRSVVYEVDTRSFSRRIADPGQYSDNNNFNAIQTGLSMMDGDRFLATYAPSLRLVVVGAVHIAQFLVPIARLLGYETIVVDPREAFASSARFPDTERVHDWPDKALSDLAPDSRTAIVTLTHDPKLDDPALHVALKSGAFYIGSLGSKRTHAKRVSRLQEAGFNNQQISQIHGPVGSDIGSVSPAEIAVSIIAEVTACLRSPEKSRIPNV